MAREIAWVRNRRRRGASVRPRPRWRILRPELLFLWLVVCWSVGTTNLSVNAELRFETTHKMGVLLTTQFMKRFRDITNGTTGKGEPGVVIPSRVRDPSVVVVRDLFDATLSGYLYHKSGRECWLNIHGGPPRRRGEHMAKTNWTRYVTTVPVPHAMRWPQWDICRTLANTTEAVGMGIYLEFARNRYYRTAVQLKQRREDPTLFVCYEDLLQYPDAIEARVRSFYQDYQTHKTTNTTSQSFHRVGRNQSWNNTYRGGHATDHDPQLRTRLRRIAMELDCVYFGCETQAWTETLNCTSEAHWNHEPRTAHKEEEDKDETADNKHESNFPTETGTPSKPNRMLWVQWVVLVGMVWLYKRKRPRSDLRRK